MRRRVLILACGGLYKERFGWTQNRFLVPIAGEPLIVRTVRQVGKYDLPVIVVTRHEDVQESVPCYHILADTGSFSETLLKTWELWTDWTVILSGDVAFPDELLDAIINYRQDVLTIHGKPYGDHDVAVTFPYTEAALVIEACQRAMEGIAARKAEHGADAWVGSTGPFMRALHNIDLWTTPDRLDYQYHRPLDVGWCMDFDRPEHYKVFLERNPWAK